MKLFTVASLLTVLALAGCKGGPGPEPAVMVIGDSVSIQWTYGTRANLCGSVVVQHETADVASNAPDAPQKSCVGHYAYAMPRPSNAGCAASFLDAGLTRLDSWHYNVIVFNVGLHDAQSNEVIWHNGNLTYTCGGPLHLDEYREDLEKIADFLQQHADAVVFVTTTPVTEVNVEHVPVGGEILYNQVLKDVAREHGFHILTFTGVTTFHHDIHLDHESSRIASNEAAACIETVLQGSESEDCHL